MVNNDQVSPQAVEMEEAVLGACMLERDVLPIVLPLLRPQMMYKHEHVLIMNAIVYLSDRGAPVDILTVTERLKNTNQLVEVGGAYYITKLTGRVASSANCEYHATIIVQKFIQRELFTQSQQIGRNAYKDGIDVFDMLDDAERRIFSIGEVMQRGNSIKHISDIVAGVQKDYESAVEAHKEGKTIGVTTGHRDLDLMTAGWQPADLVIIAARPAMGKTAFVMGCGKAAAEAGKPVAVFNLEMKDKQLIQRLLVGEAEVSAHRFKNGTMADHEVNSVWETAKTVSALPMYVDDTASLSIFELRAKCRRLKAQHDIQLVIVDYLQLMTVGNESRHGNREQEISTISRSLKSIAKELNIPVLALSQLSRAVETRGGDKRPQLSDLRESGAIEQDADMVMFIHRPEYFGFYKDADGNDTTGMAEILIAKHRNGSVGKVNLTFIDRLTKFFDRESEAPAAQPMTQVAPNTEFLNKESDTNIEEDPF